MRTLLGSAFLFSLLAISGPVAWGQGLDFNRDIRPILARHCFKCHGPDDGARKAKLRLDVRDAALRPGRSGTPAVVAGKPDESELVRRVFAAEPGEVMPPPATKNPLTEGQKHLLRRWVAEGAVYTAHWAFVAPRQAPLPRVRQTDWPRNAIDFFVLARLEAAGLRPSPPADRYTLVRRVYLDLIGLPPTPAEADAFVHDPAPDAYERLVDRLLASPAYGERWARRWLDLARYADTNGYEKDRVRSMWLWRDWVIAALNADLPFDRFTVEQLAGDLLPGATLAQRIATGFHRNTMLNEEGGIDPLEFRFHAVTDRVGTTGTVWLGLTLGCAQCHTHKYDPIPQREYYQVLAFLNNADEPEIEVPQPDLAARRAELEREIAARVADLPNRFPPAGGFVWHTPRPARVTTASDAVATVLDDGSVRLSGPNPERDTYTVRFDANLPDVAAVRLEALTDPSLPSTGPGRTPHGNFVLSEITVTAAPRSAVEKAESVKLVRAEADAAQDGFPAAHAIDGDPKTGWAVHVAGLWNVNRAATFHLERPLGFPGGTRWTIRLDQRHGTQHTLGRFRLRLGQRQPADRPLEVRRRENLERPFNDWLRQEGEQAVRWTVLRPAEAKSNLPLLTVLDDGSVLASGDMSKRDVYDLVFRGDGRGVTAVRLEVLPDPSLPKHGPGRVWYEGPPGDFFLSELTLAADGRPVRLVRASQSYADGGNGAAKTIDGDPHTGWSIKGGQGRAHAAVFNLAEPLGDAQELGLRLLFERYYAAGLGRFRVSVTRDAKPQAAVEARGLPADVEELLLIPAGQRTAAQRDRLLRHYLSGAPELAAERAAIQKLRDQLPAYPTTLVLSERPPNNPRPTFLHRRGEFLQPTERVEPDALSFLPPLPPGAPRNRLTFARWLVDPGNPLVGRVTMNRQWAAFFGRGIVRTTEDFGFQGEPPTHPELLDWLAVELVKQGWSVKKMHRLIVTSATYQQASRVTPELREKDPRNELLARGPRFRLEAELIRDAALKASGLLYPKLGGPSVFPPQPPGVTSEGTYGPLAWKVSPGPDRHRRGLYTFMKRTAPYALFSTFDAPSGEACVARREVSNTPLQALTLLNDAVFVEAAQALGRQMAAAPGSVEARLEELFRRCLTRPATDEELAALVQFYEAQQERLRKGELNASALAGPGGGDERKRAAWTLLARALLNLDEGITKD
jgi:Protein of unknown function (DUF1553)/Protein of unknown function (DUF1549)/Planctomycete cytochrome C